MIFIGNYVLGCSLCVNIVNSIINRNHGSKYYIGKLYMRSESIAVLWLLAAFFAVPFYLSNPGGVGLAIPNNVIDFFVMLGLILICWVTLPLCVIRVTKTSWIIICFFIVLLAPLFYTHPEWHLSAGWRLSGLLAGVIFYFTCLQLRLRAQWRQRIVYFIVAVTAIQALLALLQLFAPAVAYYWWPITTRRAVGIFQQPNVLASFLATGLALALMAFLLPTFVLKNKSREYCRCIALGLMLVIFPAVLVWGQSRTGWLGGLLVVVLFLLYFGRQLPRRSLIASVLVVSSVSLAIIVMHVVKKVGYVSHDFSNHARSQMLLSTLEMIAKKPWFGWGYGGFEYSYQHFRMMQGNSIADMEIARHPHNEILLWWVEGGIFGLLGMLLLLAAGVLLLRRAWQYDRAAFATGKRTAGQAMALCFTLVPILLHTQTEYPFYLSAIHWIVFLMLLAMLDRLVSPMAECKVMPKFWQPLVRGGIIIFSTAGMLTMAAGLYSGMLLTQVEKSGFRDMNKVLTLPAVLTWMHSDRYQFDRHLYMLLRFNQTGDEKLLEDYTLWAQDYLTRRIDKNVYANLLLILRYQQHPAKAERLRNEAVRLFPSDVRFQ
jgi:O-antigen polymerase